MSDKTSISMTSNRPYLLRAVYDWITDNDLTPYILIDAHCDGVKVPPQAVKDGKVVMNLAVSAVVNLDLGNDWISFQARFSGVSHHIYVPIQAVLAVYAQENGQGMIFRTDEELPPSDDTPPPNPNGDHDKSRRNGAHLRVVK